MGSIGGPADPCRVSQPAAIVIAMPAKVSKIDQLSAVYRPKMADAEWFEIQDFVLTKVRAVRDAVPYTEGRLNVALAQHALWCWTAGFGLEDDVVFSREMIDASIASGFEGLTRSSRATARSILIRIAAEIVPELHPVRLQSLPSAPAQQPYSARELAGLATWAEGQRTAARRRSAYALISLGCGAGLASGEILRVRAGDVQFDDHGAVVALTGDRARSVPVLSSWVPYLRSSGEAASAGDFLFRPGSRGHDWSLITNFVLQGAHIGVRPQTQRMRSTWIVHHLTRGTFPVQLVRAAGVSTFESLSRFAAFVPELDADTARRALSAG